MNWTDERVALLTKLWAEGLSASQIAAQLGGVSRNAVIGKVHRLKLSGRGKTTKAQPRAPKTNSPASISAAEEKIVPINSSVSSIASPARATRINVEKPAPRVEKTTTEPHTRKSPPLTTPPLTTMGSAHKSSTHQFTPKPSPQASAPNQHKARPQSSFTASSINVNFTSNEAANFDAQSSDSNVVPMKRNLTLLQLTEITCKWPIGDPLNEDFHFCGADAGEASPYCSYHSKIAFQTISDRRRIRA